MVWLGWGSIEGSISTTLHRKRKAILDFGNCWSGGNVDAYKNDVELLSVGAKSEDQVEFEDGDVLKIIEHNTAIIQFNSLKIVGSLMSLTCLSQFIFLTCIYSNSLVSSMLHTSFVCGLTLTMLVMSCP